MRISDWSSDVCSSDLFRGPDLDSAVPAELVAGASRLNNAFRRLGSGCAIFVEAQRHDAATYPASTFPDAASALVDAERKADFEEAGRSEDHTSELQSLMRISYADFRLQQPT